MYRKENREALFEGGYQRNSKDFKEQAYNPAKERQGVKAILKDEIKYRR